jgi:hypothetical protein
MYTKILRRRKNLFAYLDTSSVQRKKGNPAIGRLRIHFDSGDGQLWRNLLLETIILGPGANKITNYISNIGRICKYLTRSLPNRFRNNAAQEPVNLATYFLNLEFILKTW